MNLISIITTSIAGGIIIYEVVKYTSRYLRDRKYVKQFIEEEIKPEVEREKLRVINFE